jgi:hypothetical protein
MTSSTAGQRKNAAQDRFPLALRLARQKVVCAHAEAQRQYRDRRGNDQKKLLVDAELCLVQSAD